MTRRSPYLDYDASPLQLDEDGRAFPRFHVFDDLDVDAVNTALAVGRPLLVRGEPGAGKSQLALAAAVRLERPLVKEVVDSRTESRDLLWHFDAVGRLADAQSLAKSREALRLQWFKDQGRLTEDAETFEGVDPLDEGFYTTPGPLWWGLDWQGALGQAAQAEQQSTTFDKRFDPSRGVVVLIDEIDKADDTVPNGLLGVLGDREFAVPRVGTVRATGPAPLVIVTTNEERTLPDAFLRRCVVHEMTLDTDPHRLKQWLIRRGKAHFSEFDFSDQVYDKAAALVIQDRDTCERQGLSRPGAAEYLDLLRAVAERRDADEDVEKVLGRARRFVLRKHSDRYFIET